MLIEGIFSVLCNYGPALGDNDNDGIDLYFENMGGDHLQAALSHMKVHA
jgi:NADPH-dependent curcumin reductase CurA